MTSRQCLLAAFDKKTNVWHIPLVRVNHILLFTTQSHSSVINPTFPLSIPLSASQSHSLYNPTTATQSPLIFLQHVTLLQKKERASAGGPDELRLMLASLLPLHLCRFGSRCYMRMRWRWSGWVERVSRRMSTVSTDFSHRLESWETARLDRSNWYSNGRDIILSVLNYWVEKILKKCWM